ncbi:igE-binding protein-like, partial [Aphis craccivora]
KKKLDASQEEKFRIVVDFRALNNVTINEHHALPNITEILDQLGQCKLFSIIDLVSGFYQIKLDKDTLLNLKTFCEDQSLNKLAMNKLGFNDKLEWAQDRAMIRHVFRNTDIKIIICSKFEFSDDEKLIIFKQCHDSKIGGHVGIHRTIKKINDQFNWIGLKEDVIDYIKNCESCQKGKVTNKKGTDFLSKIFTEVCKLLQINKINNSPFHPQTNGSLERSHRTLTEYLRHYVDKKLNNWDEYLPYAFFVYNSTEHTSTGYQPYSLLNGRRLDIPVKLSHEPEPRYNYDNYYFDLKQKMQESHKIARENLIKRKIKSKQIYDSNENPIM